jgi:hypothetical protein
MEWCFVWATPGGASPAVRLPGKKVVTANTEKTPAGRRRYRDWHIVT